jgi:transglutaminase-like putative cysteine protease
MINNYRVLLWFSTLNSIAVGGAVSSLFSLQAGVAATVVTIIASLFTLKIGWSVRKEESANKPISDGIAIAGLALFLSVVFTQNLMVALGVLLFFAQLAINVVIREYRQLYLGLVASFVYLLMGASESKSGFYLIVFVLYGLSTSFCLGEAWLDSKTNIIRNLPSPPIWQRLKVAATILTLALFIYLIMPRPSAANFGSQQSSSDNFYSGEEWEKSTDNAEETNNKLDQDTNEPSQDKADGHRSNETYNYPGFDSQFNIQKAGEGGRQNGNAIVAYMTAPHGTYLKVRTFDVFDGSSWSASTAEFQKKKVKAHRVSLLEEQANFQQVIEIEATMSPWLPAAPQPATIWIPATVIGVDAWQQPLLSESLRAGTRYTVDSVLTLIQGRPFAGDAPPREEDLQLPEEFQPRIKTLAEQVTDQINTPFAKAVALEQHLRTEYEYSFESIFQSQGFTPLDKFLFEEKRGHCEYFASAMAIMLRSLDIPARLITGFSVTQKNPLTGFYEIRALDGHAWVEAWIEGTGWVTFEPTAFYELPAQNESALSAEQINEYVEELQRAEEILGRDDFSFTALFASIWQTFYTFVVVIFSYLKLFVLNAWPYLAMIMFLIAVVVFTQERWLPTVQIRYSLWKIKHYTPKEQRSALHFYLFHLQLIAGYYGLKRAPEEGIEAWTKRLTKHFGRHDCFQFLCQTVNQSFYEEERVLVETIRQIALESVDAITTSK